MSPGSPSEALDQLLSRMSEARLSTEQRRQLAGLIEADPELRQRFLDYCQMHAILLSEQGLLASTVEPGLAQLEPAGSAGSVGSPRHHGLMWLALVAVLLIAFTPLMGPLVAPLMGPFSDLRPSESSLPVPPQAAPPRVLPSRGAAVATLSQAVGASFAYGVAGELTTAIGTAIPAGVYRLQRGVAEFAYASGVMVTIEAPASFALVSQETVELLEGKLSAHVPQAAVGFTVETPRAAVVDLGTDFGVEVKRQDEEVHVFTGVVRVDLRAEVGPNPTPLRLVTGEATRINRRTGLPAGINLDKQRFWRGFQADARHPYCERVRELGPSVYYPMDPTEEGTQVEDLSGNQATAAVSLGRTVRPIWTAGRFGTALDLGGPAQGTYAAAKWYPQSEHDQLSVVAWVHARSRPRWASIVKNWAGTNERGQFHFGLYQDVGDLEVHIEDDSGNEVIAREGVALPLDQWHWVTFVADGAMLRLFRNGQQVAATPYHGLHCNARVQALGIGTKLNLRGDAPEEQDFNMWDGRLDEIAIFNRALSQEEILNLYRLSLPAD